jgi:hypothetical protein
MNVHQERNAPNIFVQQSAGNGPFGSSIVFYTAVAAAAAVLTVVTAVAVAVAVVVVVVVRWARYTPWKRFG